MIASSLEPWSLFLGKIKWFFFTLSLLFFLLSLIECFVGLPFNLLFLFEILEVEQEGGDANLSEVFSVTSEHGGQGEGLWRQTAWV